jgi:hypothetical protein
MSTTRKGQTGRRDLTNYLSLCRFVAFRHFFRIKEQRFLRFVRNQGKTLARAYYEREAARALVQASYRNRAECVEQWLLQISEELERHLLGGNDRPERRNRRIEAAGKSNP